MKTIIYLILLCLMGCNFTAALNSQGKPIEYICEMKDFKGFPKKVQGKLAFELKKTLTIFVQNKDKSQRVDLTFEKKYCKEVK